MRAHAQTNCIQDALKGHVHYHIQLSFAVLGGFFRKCIANEQFKANMDAGAIAQTLVGWEIKGSS